MKSVEGDQPTSGGSGRDDPKSPAERALAEAEARRKTRSEASLPTEIDGRPGPEPVRYGDWENKGIASDF